MTSRARCHGCGHSMGFHNEAGCVVILLDEEFCRCEVARSLEAPKLELEQCAARP